MSVTHLQTQGRDAYKRGDFEKALEYFNKAIGRGSPTPQLFDHLAATHVKLNDLKSALNAAKKAIKAGPEDPTGYLRSGRILQQMENQSVALEIYAFGLKQVRHVGTGYGHLKGAHDKLMKDLAPMNSVDPMTVLPRELALQVLEYLTFRERSLIRMVTKEWDTLIRSEPKLWVCLDLTGAKSKVRNKFVSTAINTARSKLTAARLSRLWDFDKALTALIQATQLTSLTLLDTGLQGENLVKMISKAQHLSELRIMRGTDVHEHTLIQIVNRLQSQLKVLHCSTVDRLDFRSNLKWKLELPKLESIFLKASKLHDIDRLFDALANGSPELKSITLHDGAKPIDAIMPLQMDLRRCKKLEHVDLRLRLFTQRQLQLPSSVQTLYLESLHGNNAQSFLTPVSVTNQHQHQFLMSDLLHLEELYLNCQGMPLNDINAAFCEPRSSGEAFESSKHLQTLLVENSVVPDAQDFTFASRLKKLRHLALRHASGLHDCFVEMIVLEQKDLRILDLSGSEITGVAIRAIIKAGQVRELVINDCPNIGRDAIDLAKSNDIKVEHKITSQANALGRRVRY